VAWSAAPHNTPNISNSHPAGREFDNARETVARVFDDTTPAHW
jgi:hypothetical protein